jgi:hypothetical protein
MAPPDNRTVTQPRLAGFWFLLALLGQAATLRLTSAGSSIGYQHLLTPWQATEPHYRWALAVVLFQSFVVALAWRPRAASAWHWLQAELGAWRTLVLGGLMVLTGTALSREIPVYAGELLFAGFLQILALATVTLAVLALPRTVVDRGWKWVAALGGTDDDHHGLDRVAMYCALWVACLAALLAVVSYQRHPHIPDELSYLLQAKYFATGQMTMALPPVPEAFRLDLMTYEAERWYSPFPPGWPAMLALGVLAGVPWLVNPLLGGVGVLLTFVLVRDLYDRGVARTVVIMMAASPWYVFMAMSYMAHTFTTVVVLGTTLAVLWLRRSRGIAWALLGGFGIGVVSINRPLEGLVLAGVLGLWVLVPDDVGVSFRQRVGRLVTLAGATAATAALVFPYNAHLTGRPLYFPVMAYADRVYGEGTNALGFGPDRGFGWPGLDPLPGHGLIDVLINANLNLFAVNVELHGWATGSLLLIAFFLLRGRVAASDWLMVAIIMATVAAHSLYWFSGGPDFGARYWYLILLPCLVLSARGLAALAQAHGDDGAIRVYAGTAILIVMTMVTFVPWRASDKYFQYRGMQPGVRTMEAAHDFGRSVVFIRGRQFPDYASAAAYNPVDLSGDEPIFVWATSEEVVAEVIDAFPDRTRWFVDGPSITGDGYRVSSGPHGSVPSP